MGKQISDEIKKQIPILYSEIGIKAEVARRLNISISTVNKYLTLYEATPNLISENDQLIKQINDHYYFSRNMNQVARELGVSSYIVKKYLSEENLRLKEKEREDYEALLYYIFKLFGQYNEEEIFNPWNIIQTHKFKSKGINYKAQLLCLKYFYEIKHNSLEKSNNSIGIIPYIYDETARYYQAERRRIEETDKAIQKQLSKDRITINFDINSYMSPQKKKKKKTINLNSLEENK